MNKATILNEKFITFCIGILAMIALLQYNWAHTAAMFNNYIHNSFSAGVAAFGVELSVIWLSWRLGKLKNLEGGVFFSVPGITLIAVIVMSMVANWSEGFKIKHGVALTSQTIQMVDWMDIVFGIVATVFASAIVFALSEVLSGDSKKLTPKQSKNADESHVAQLNVEEPRINVVRSELKPLSKSTVSHKRRELKPKTDKEMMFVKYITENPNATYREIINNTKIVSNVSQVKPLAESLGYHKNGNGWEKSAGI